MLVASANAARTVLKNRQQNRQRPIGVKIKKLYDRHLMRGGRASSHAGNRSIIVDIA